MSEFHIENRTWTEAKIRRLVGGVSVPDSSSMDGWADVPRQSWYQLQCAAYDKGDGELLLDAIQLESAVEQIDDAKVRAAVTLALHGWDGPEIGAAVGGRRTGEQLVLEGIRVIAKWEETRG